jgi:hypothetical protein
MSFIFEDSFGTFPFERNLDADRKPPPSKDTVCKYWVFGRCKLGDECFRLHVWDRAKMPLCTFYSESGVCNRPDCVFLHIGKGENKKECAWYNRGFCKHGPRCRNTHVRRIACPDYMAGFCAKGLACEYAHPNFDCAHIMRETTEERRSEREQLAQQMHLPYAHESSKEYFTQGRDRGDRGDRGGDRNSRPGAPGGYPSSSGGYQQRPRDGGYSGGRF